MEPDAHTKEVQDIGRAVCAKTKTSCLAKLSIHNSGIVANVRVKIVMEVRYLSHIINQLYRHYTYLDQS